MRESEGQQVVRYLDRLKLQIRDKIGVHVLCNLNEAKNITLRAELMLQEKSTRFDGSSRRFRTEGPSMSVAEKDKVVLEGQKGVSEKVGDKGMGKKPIEPRDSTK